MVEVRAARDRLLTRLSFQTRYREVDDMENPLEIVEGLKVLKKTLKKSGEFKSHAEVHAREAISLLDKFADTQQPELLKSIQFHRRMAKSYRNEAAKYVIAAQEVMDHYGLAVDTDRKQANLKRTGRKKPTIQTETPHGPQKARTRGHVRRKRAHLGRETGGKVAPFEKMRRTSR